MSQLADVHNAAAAQIKANVARDINVAGWPFSGKPLPVVEVWPDRDYFDPYGDSDSITGLVRINLSVTVIASTANGETAQRVMTDLLGWQAGSIFAALESDRTLGGVCDDLVITGPVRWDTSEDAKAQTGSIPVTVYVQKETA